MFHQAHFNVLAHWLGFAGIIGLYFLLSALYDWVLYRCL